MKNKNEEHGVNNEFWVKIVRPAVLKRDNHQCTKCGKDKNLHIHHLDYIKQTIDNLLTLCSTCHKKEHLEEKGE